MRTSKIFSTPTRRSTRSYAATNYQPAWGSQGILGRYFKLGVKAKF